MAGCRVRAAEPGDCGEIMRMIKELAEFEKLSDQVKNNAEDLCRDGFKEPSPFFRCLVAELVDEDRADKGKGIGSQLLTAVAESCLSLGCSHLQFSVLDWNSPAISFYKARGAHDLSQEEGWRIFRFLPDQLRQLNSNLKNPCPGPSDS
ncbi:thialysine N-epsilon-acetyltransferase isoform 2-T2 [Discoglossus pictus]